ncbi:hypothetical protein P170DRAFT_356720 [Aspergillus steynii IBT 23096]|uniref:Uncharacterized protein n=1 Tax=Aspergillus steynii IBT 23096 TaxID=1392250 RepID=A0A2I2G9L6_9EURO|nr:uncharacterized protein P170DRAFT_356720 [Aspergillus steynii IBT 23096]PLB49579.1 hypothetical protein P170DRAFT_356720 [Aspergillus steynii IBT 23096]
MESVPRSLSGSSHPNALGSPTVVTSSFSSNNNRAGANEQSLASIDLGNHTSPEQQIPTDRSSHRNSRQSRRLTLHRSAANGLAFAFPPRSSYVQIDPQSTTEETQLSDRLGQGPQAESQRHASGHRSYRPRSCASLLKEKSTRRRLITLITSAVFLIFVLALYLAFAVSHSNLGRELHILLVFMILILAIVLCHSLIRFIMVVLRDPRTLATNRIPSRAGPAGYAQPERPIPVVLAGDEEALTESQGPSREKVTVPPPAYGLWRESVRINPDLLYWQRVDQKAQSKSKRTSRADQSSNSKATAPRPPSYTSDNGIDYVVEAQPRSFSHWNIPEEPEHR